MDLLLSLPDGGPVRVSRLSADDSEEQGILFVEQLPYKPTACAWHPSGRALAVGDDEGNVFILNADAEEDRRIRELQRLNGTAVAALEWVKFVPESCVLPCGVFGIGKFPVEDVAGSDPSKESLLASLSRSGHLAYIADGSLPLADIRLPRDLNETFCLACMSPTGRHLIAGSVSNSVWRLWLVDSSVLANSSRHISEVIRLQKRALDLMKVVHASIENCTIAWKSHVTEFKSKLGDSDIAACLIAAKTSLTADSKLRSHILESLTPAKLIKWEREDSAVVETMLTAVIIKADMCVETLFLISLELQNMTSRRLAFLGIDDAADKFVASVKVLRNRLREFQSSVRLNAASCRAFFQLATAWFGGPQPEPNLITALFTARFDPFEQPPDASVKASLKAVECCIVAMLTDQRVQLSESVVCNSSPICLGECASMPAIQWKQDDTFNIVWIQNHTKLHISNCDIGGGARKAVIDLDSQPGEWNCVSAYSEDEVCLVVTLAGGLSSISLLDLREVSLTTVEMKNIADSDVFGIDANQLHEAVRAQQLPSEFCRPESLCTSSSRKLASLIANGRMITLDMQPDDEDNN